MDGPKLRRAVCRTLPPDTQREVLRAWELAIDRTAAYVSYRVVLATLSAVVHGVAFKALGVPFALSLAIWVGLVSQFIPTVGTYLAGIVPIAIALGEDPATALKVLVLILVYQQVENYVISPPLSARTMKIHPALGFVSAIGGVALIGPLGALLALPVVATVQSFLAIYVPRNRLVEDDLLSDQGGPTGDTLDEDPRAVAGDKARRKAPAKKAPVKKAAAKKG
jgi:predicted PurR-regulated permease PerM